MMRRSLILCALVSLGACAADASGLSPFTTQAPAPAPGVSPVLSVSTVYPGATVSFVIEDANPFEYVYLALGTGVGPGFCGPIFGGRCLNVRGAPVLAGVFVADAQGTVDVTLQAPDTLTPGNRLAFQVAVIRGWDGADTRFSNAVPITIQVPPCGDGVVDVGEDCDDGNDVDEDACLTTCVDNTCGDGILHPGVEACDDGNLVNGDFCSDTCQVDVLDVGYTERLQPFIGDVIARDMATGPEGGHLVVGRVGPNSIPDRNQDVFAARYDIFGNRMWSKAIGGPGLDDGTAVVEAPDGSGWFVAGTTLDNGVSTSFLMKLGLDGQLLGMNVHDGGYFLPEQLIIGNNGDVIGVGSVAGGPHGEWDVNVARWTQSGVLLGMRAYGTSSRDYAYAVVEREDGGLVIGSETQSREPTNLDSDGAILRLAPDGSVLWTWMYRAGVKRSHEAILVNDTHIFTSGEHLSGGSVRTFVLRTDLDGNADRYQEFDDGGNLTALAWDDDGGLLVGGYLSQQLAPSLYDRFAVVLKDDLDLTLTRSWWFEGNAFRPKMHRMFVRDTGGLSFVLEDDPDATMVQVAFDGSAGACENASRPNPRIDATTVPFQVSASYADAVRTVGSSVPSPMWTAEDVAMAVSGSCSDVIAP